MSACSNGKGGHMIPTTDDNFKTLIRSSYYLTVVGNYNSNRSQKRTEHWKTIKEIILNHSRRCHHAPRATGSQSSQMEERMLTADMLTAIEQTLCLKSSQTPHWHERVKCRQSRKWEIYFVSRLWYGNDFTEKSVQDQPIFKILLCFGLKLSWRFGFDFSSFIS